MSATRPQPGLKQRQRRVRVAAGVGAVLGLHAAAAAQFSGPYAPANWTFNANGGDGSINLSAVPDAITLVGNDNGRPFINTDYTIVAPAAGLWSFSWQTIPMDTGNLDIAYYLLNGVEHFLGDNTPPHSGAVQGVVLNAGDVIGFRVWSEDGVLGALSLKITNFNAPVPGPGGPAAALASGLWIARRRRRARPLIMEERGKRV